MYTTSSYKKHFQRPKNLKRLHWFSAIVNSYITYYMNWTLVLANNFKTIVVVNVTIWIIANISFGKMHLE